MKRINIPRDSAAHNSRLIRRPIQRMVWLFLLPTFAAFCIGFLYPFFKGAFLSFCKFKLTSQWTWVGFSNYIKALSDSSFLHAFWYTALFAFVSVVFINVLAFTVAYFLTKGIRGSNLFRTVFFMPNLIGGIVLGYIWSMIFDGFLVKYNTSVVLNSTFGFWGLIILICWQQVGYMMIIYIAGLQSIPEDMLEAARIDGANNWQTLWKITIPNMMSSFTICIFLTLTNGFKLFDQNLALTAGRPFLQQPDGSVIKTTEMLALNIYSAFYSGGGNNRGVGQAKAVVFFILVAAIGLLQLQATRKKGGTAVMAKREERGKMVLTIIFTVICIAYIMPILIVLMNSFKSNAAVNTQTFAFPNANSFVGFQNYIKGMTFGNYPFLKAVGCSLFITLASTALILVCTSMAAWYVSRVGSFFSKIVYYLCVFSMVVPFQMVMFTLSRTANQLSLDTPWTIPVIYLGFGAGLAVFMFCGFVKSIPLEIEEAAAIDGCGPVRTFFQVVLPMMKPTMISVGVLEIMWVWNDFLLPYLVLDRTEYMTIPIVIQHLKGSYGQVDMGATMALILLSILPVIIFYLCCQKHIIKGVAAGAVKG